MTDLRGSIAIPVTPFDDRDRVDEDVLRGEVEFCIARGASGLAIPMMASEFLALSESERLLMVRVTIEATAGRVPVIANCAGPTGSVAADLARRAEGEGASAVIAMPPYPVTSDFDSTYAYYQTIAAAVSVPVWIQNAGLAPLSPEQVVQLCTEIDGIDWVKEEVPPSPRSVSSLLDMNSAHVAGVIGGAGGRFLMTEHARGASGCMHACEFVDVVQKIWRLLDAGAVDEAGDLFEKLLPALVLENMLGMAFAKEILVRRGVLRNHRVRGQVRPLDTHDLREIDRCWERVQPLLAQ